MPFRDGYRFDGWYTGINGSGSYILSTSTVTIVRDITLYAKWTDSAITVTLNAQGGRVSPSSIQAVLGETYCELPLPSKSGYYFFGWYTGINGSGSLVKSADTVALTGDITLYAKWVSNSSVKLATPPINVKALDYKTVQVSWKAVKNATSYIVFKSISSSKNFVPVANLKGVLSYTDIGLTANVKYYYKVQAYWAPFLTPVYSSYSSVKYGKTAWPSITLKASPQNYNSISLSWNTIAGAEGYQIYRSVKSNSGYVMIKDGITGTSYVDSSATTGVTYYYEVCAIDTDSGAMLYSPLSKYKSAKTVPDIPENLQVVQSGDTSIHLSWDPAGGATGYEVYRAASLNGKYTRVTTITDSPFNDTGLTTGKTYYYKIRVFCVVGKVNIYGAYSAIKSCKI